jgi:hypothetical protein
MYLGASCVQEERDAPGEPRPLSKQRCPGLGSRQYCEPQGRDNAIGREAIS